MNVSQELDEAEEIAGRMLGTLLSSVLDVASENGVEARRAVGSFLADFGILAASGRLGTELLACFSAASAAGVNDFVLNGMLDDLFAEQPQGGIGGTLIQTSIVFTMGAITRNVVVKTFTSRDDVEQQQATLKLRFDAAIELAADHMASDCYADLIRLSATVTRHLTIVALPLPRMIDLLLPVSIPALAVAQYVYADASRWEEIVAQNKVVHPAFPLRELRVLSA